MWVLSDETKFKITAATKIILYLTVVLLNMLVDEQLSLLTIVNYCVSFRRAIGIYPAIFSWIWQKTGFWVWQNMNGNNQNFCLRLAHLFLLLLKQFTSNLCIYLKISRYELSTIICWGAKPFIRRETCVLKQWACSLINLLF